MQHLAAEVLQDWADLGMEVSEHLVGLPMIEEADDICVNAAT